jgi:hypothetical protein
MASFSSVVDKMRPACMPDEGARTEGPSSAATIPDGPECDAQSLQVDERQWRRTSPRTTWPDISGSPSLRQFAAEVVRKFASRPKEIAVEAQILGTRLRITRGLRELQRSCRFAIVAVAAIWQDAAPAAPVPY